MAVARVVTGGQSGVDRAALDVAIAAGVPYGGFVPRDGWAEDLPHPPGVLSAYPRLTPTASDDPLVRTVANVVVADATLVVTSSSRPSRGTTATTRAAEARGRPLLIVEPDAQGVDDGLADWLMMLPAACALNVAGPRESEWPGAYRTARSYLEARAGLLFGAADAAVR